MILRLHGVFLGLTALALVHALRAARSAEPGARRPFEQWTLVPLLLGLAALLVSDRVLPEHAPLASGAVLAWLFPLAYALALAQNAVALLRRGARLLDIPLVLFNVGVGSCVLLAVLAQAGVPLGFHASALLYEGASLQALLGTRLAHDWTLSFHLPWLLSRAPRASLREALAGLLPGTVAALAVLMLVLLHEPARDEIAAFESEPRVTTLPADLLLGAWWRPRPGDPPPPPGDVLCLRLPADHDGAGLPAGDGRPLLLELAFPDAWHRRPPDAATRDAALLAGAARLAARLQPAILLPLPEPDGEASLHFGPDTTPAQWRALFEAAAAAVHDASPATRLGVRLAGTGRASQAVLEALIQAPAVVSVAGPRLFPVGPERGPALHGDSTLALWQRWLAASDDPPQLWILAYGLSPLAFGETAQARFVEGALARAAAQAGVAGAVAAGWTDAGHTQGLLRGDGSPRAAGARWLAILAAPRAAARR